MRSILYPLAIAFITAIAPVHASEPVITPLTTFTGEDREPSVSPDGKFIAYLSDRKGDRSNQLWLLNLTTGTTEMLVDSMTVSGPAAWHPDGQTLVFAGKSIASEPETLWRINRDGSSLSAVDTSSVTRAHMAPHISPDGKWLAYSQRMEAGTSNWDIVLQNLATGMRKPLSANSEYREIWPRFTSSGKELTYFSRADTAGDNDEIYRLTLATGANERLTQVQGHDFTPTSSPMGPIAFVSNRSGSSLLYIMNHDGSGQTIVNTGNFQARQPVWSPDGTKLYFTGRPNAGGPADIMMMENPQSVLTN